MQKCLPQMLVQSVRTKHASQSRTQSCKRMVMPSLCRWYVTQRLKESHRAEVNALRLETETQLDVIVQAAQQRTADLLSEEEDKFSAMQVVYDRIIAHTQQINRSLQPSRPLLALCWMRRTRAVLRTTLPEKLYLYVCSELRSNTSNAPRWRLSSARSCD